MRLSCPPKSRTSVETSVRGSTVRLQAEGTKRVFIRKSEEECNPKFGQVTGTWRVRRG